MHLYIALAASPLTNLHTPKSLDVRSLKHHITDIPEIRKGEVKYDIEYDAVGDDKPHHSAHINLESDMGSAYLAFHRQESNWRYTGETVINGEVTPYAGETAHYSFEAICRKVRAVILKIV